MFQTKDPNKTPVKKKKKKASEMEISILLNKEFKEAVMRILTILKRRMEEFSENVNKDFKNIRKNQSEIQNTITRIKYRKHRVSNQMKTEIHPIIL